LYVIVNYRDERFNQSAGNFAGYLGIFTETNS